MTMHNSTSLGTLPPVTIWLCWPLWHLKPLHRSGQFHNHVKWLGNVKIQLVLWGMKTPIQNGLYCTLTPHSPICSVEQAFHKVFYWPPQQSCLCPGFLWFSEMWWIQLYMKNDLTFLGMDSNMKSLWFNPKSDLEWPHLPWNGLESQKPAPYQHI